MFSFYVFFVCVCVVFVFMSVPSDQPIVRLGINLVNDRLVRLVMPTLVMPTLIHRGKETYHGI